MIMDQEITPITDSENKSKPINVLAIDQTLRKYRMKQPFKILTDIWGVLIPYQFRTELYRYIDEHLYDYILVNYHKPEVYSFIVDLVRRTMEDRTKYPQMPMIGLDDCCDDQQTKVRTICENLQYRRMQTADSLLNDGIDTIYNQVWSEGYRTKQLRPPLFSDVMRNFAKWHTDPYYIKIYTFASGPIDSQRLFLSASTEGDVTQYLISGFDAHSYYKYDWTKFQAVIASLGERIPANLFYFTDSPTKGRSAARAGITTFIIKREGNRKYRPKDLELFTTIDSLDQFDFVPLDHCGC
ncbi:hypothetical protein RDWZM_000417 [Blomia tropicalis]|uniref:Uncharacterized protein n=1 Tax=Blomia tropicalis TaxID=40697 RepID=A0A9Q0MA17_BLOTA|nr:Enolase-phosphatase E1 [Blomia tropicalis]KAJ6221872.1 hypothetical protein RDWZM_000417 [Blomia tropicalis]